MEQLKNRNLIMVLTLLSFGSVLTSIIFWHNMGILFADPLVNVTNTTIIFTNGTYMLAAYGLLMSFIIITSLVIPTTWLRLAIFALLSLPLLTTNYPGIVIAIMFITLIGALSYFDFRIQKEIAIHTKLPVRHVFGRAIHLISFLIAVMLSVFLFFSVNASISETTITLPDEFFSQALTLSAPLIDTQIENYLDTLEQTTITQLEKQLPFLFEIPYEDKALLLKGTVTPLLNEKLKTQGLSNQQIQDLADRISSAVENESAASPQETISSIKNDLETNIVGALSQQLNKLLDQYKDFVPYIVAISSYTLFNFLGLLINALAIGLAQLLVKILLKTKLVDTHKFMIEAHRYVIKE